MVSPSLDSVRAAAEITFEVEVPLPGREPGSVALPFFHGCLIIGFMTSAFFCSLTELNFAETASAASLQLAKFNLSLLYGVSAALSVERASLAIGAANQYSYSARGQR